MRLAILLLLGVEADVARTAEWIAFAFTTPAGQHLVHLWKPGSTEILTLGDYPDPIWYLKWSPDSRRLAIVRGNDGKWDL